MRLFGLGRSQKKLLEAQNDLIQKHCDEVENIYRQMRAWRHDFHNHIQAIESFLALEKYEQCREYCKQIDEDMVAVDTVVRSGNVMLDAILNSKLSLARSRNIVISAKAAVPKQLSISDVDFCVLIGNLLDNALDACTPPENAVAGKTEFDAPFIRVYIGMKGINLYICVTNAVYGRAKSKGGRFFSTKKMPGHGFGLLRIDRICEKYGGYIARGSEQDAFSTEILLPVGKEA